MWGPRAARPTAREEELAAALVGKKASSLTSHRLPPLRRVRSCRKPPPDPWNHGAGVLSLQRGRRRRERRKRKSRASSRGEATGAGSPGGLTTPEAIDGVPPAAIRPRYRLISRSRFGFRFDPVLVLQCFPALISWAKLLRLLVRALSCFAPCPCRAA